MSEPLAVRAGDAQQFATPRGAVGTEPDAIEREPQHRAADAMLGQHGRDMRMMVLRADQRHRTRARKPGGEAGAVEVRMQVVDDRLRRDLEHFAQVLDRLVERAAGRRVVERPDVLRQERLARARHADGVLEVATDRENRRPVVGEANRQRRVAARAADEGGPAVVLRAYDAVVAAEQHVAVVHQQGIGDASKPAHGLGVVDDQRFATRVGAGHYEHEFVGLLQPAGAGGTASSLVEQQQMQRCRRQHQPQRRHARGHARQRDSGRGALLDQHDRALGRLQQRAFGRIRERERRARRDVRHHDCEGLLLARLALAQPRDGRGVAGITGELEAAEALDRDDLARAQALECRRDRILDRDRLAVRPQQREPWPADGAGVRLRVEPAIERIVVFLLARRALPEARHAGVGPVVGQGSGDRVARSAVRAVGEGIAPAAILRIKHLVNAVCARR